MLLQWEAGDDEVIDLWQKMNGWVYEGFDKTYTKTGCSILINTITKAIPTY
jgi:arginyl-tRNA synthetase